MKDLLAVNSFHLFVYLGTSLFCFCFSQVVLLDVRFLVDILILSSFNVIPLPSGHFICEEVSAVNLVMVPVYVLSHFSLAAVRLFPVLNFSIFIMTCLVDL